MGGSGQVSPCIINVFFVFIALLIYTNKIFVAQQNCPTCQLSALENSALEINALEINALEIGALETSAAW